MVKGKVPVTFHSFRSRGLLFKVDVGRYPEEKVLGREAYQQDVVFLCETEFLSQGFHVGDEMLGRERNKTLCRVDSECQ